jgi:DNA-binding response OmpR family regulator
VRELVARCHALLRRFARAQQEPEAQGASGRVTQPLSVHGVVIDAAKRRVRVQDRDIELTNQEFTLLLLFAEHPGIVFSREALLEKIWKGDTFVTERSVDTLVKRLRHKVEDDPANPSLILTQWGVGYKFADV